MKSLVHCLVVLLFAAMPAVAQESDTTTTAAAGSEVQKTAAAEEAKPGDEADTAPPESRVTSVRTLVDRKGWIRLGDEVRIAITGYAQLREASVERAAPITLWINGRDSLLRADGVVPSASGAAELTYRLTRSAENSELWRSILHDPFFEKVPEPIHLSVGVSGDGPLLFGDGVNHFNIQKAFVSLEGLISMGLFLVVAILLYLYRSDMLRNGPDVDGKKQAYSLGRWQMAWWFILILASYLTIWLITGDRDTITTSSLVLMGISAATAMGSIAIEANAPARAEETRKTLEAQKASLAVSPTIVEARAGSATPQQQEAAEAIELRMAEIDQTVANVTRPPMTTGSWWRDILTDNTGMVGLHRFQIFVWTIVLGVIFVASVLRDLTMPEFNTTMLALMGISAGTYLGFKVPSGN